MSDEPTAELSAEEVAHLLWLRQDDSDSWESRRYKRVGMLRTKEVEADFNYQRNPLYRRPDTDEVDGGVLYEGFTAQYASVEDALAGVRKLLDEKA